MLEDEAHSSRRPQVFVRHDPNGKLEDNLGENSPQARRARAEGHLADADPDAGTQGSEVCSVAVGA